MIGIVGWKNSGKTTLVVRLVEAITRRGLKVATVKHAHHAFSIDDGATDSARHRRAGAGQVAIVSARRWALVTECTEEVPEPTLAEILVRLAPTDLVVVEGFKAAAIPKIEVRRGTAHGHPRIADQDPHIVAIAADHAVESTLPVFALDDIAAIADFVVARMSAHGGARS